MTLNEALIECLADLELQRKDVADCALWVAESINPTHVWIYVEPENREITSYLCPVDVLRRYLSREDSGT
jgi:hypothetical protein